jgi:S1-C subfamily serine protease
MPVRIAAFAVLLIVLAAACDDDDRPAAQPSNGYAPSTATPSPALTEADIRRIVRQELDAALEQREASRPPDCTTALAFARARPAIVKIDLRVRGTVIAAASGTGFVALAGGLVVTAAHVIRDNHDIVLTLADGRVIPASLVARDDLADLALLRAADPRLTPIRWADPNAATLGEQTVVVGYALGRAEPIVTAGVLSRRVAAAENNAVEMLETDANADPGNSGGPLLTLCGEALGLVVRIDRTTVSTTVAVGASTILPFITKAAERR